MQRKNPCSATMIWATEPMANGPRPARVQSSATSTTTNRCKPSVPGPKRTADQSKKGNGTRTSH